MTQGREVSRSSNRERAREARERARAERTSEGRQNRSDRSRDRNESRNDNSSFSRDLNSYSNIHGEALSNSLSGGGWQEHGSGNGYTSTSDRMNEHLSRYGRDNDYTTAFNNQYRSDSNFGKSSRISNAIGSHRTLTGGNAQAKQLSSLFGDQENQLAAKYKPQSTPINYTAMYNHMDASPFEKAKVKVEGPMSRIAEPRNPNANNRQNYDYVTDLVNEDFRKDAQRGILGNYAGSIAAPAVAEIAGGAIGGGLGSMAAGAIAGIASSEAGAIANMTAGRSNRDKLPKEQQGMYDQLYSEREEYFDDRRGSFDSFENGVATILGTAVDIGTKGLSMGGGSLFANTYKNNEALKKTLSHFDSSNNREWLKEEKEKITKAIAEDRVRRNAEDANKGILSNMSKRLKPAKEPQQPTLPYYAIPALTNLWNNVIIK